MSTKKSSAPGGAQERLIPAKEHRDEIVVVNSRFIISLAPAGTVEKARGFIRRVKGEFRDATHNVPAFIIGHGTSTIEHCQDDGEPGGTAGKPMLAVLRGSGIGDIVAVATRYFGGTKLGKGGLVRAYGDAVRKGLRSLPLAKKTSVHNISVVVPYKLYEKTRRLVEEHGGSILEESFAVQVKLRLMLESGETPAFCEAIKNLSRGTIDAVIDSFDPDARIPLA